MVVQEWASHVFFFSPVGGLGLVETRGGASDTGGEMGKRESDVEGAKKRERHLESHEVRERDIDGGFWGC